MMTRFRYPMFACVIALLSTVAMIADAQEKKEDLKPAFKVARYLQDISVTVRAGQLAGSGVMVQTEDKQVWIWTAAHVVSHLRHVHVSETDGGKRSKVEFDDAKIMRYHQDKGEGRIVSSFTADAEVIRYSNAAHGQDLCLMRLRDKDFKPASSAKFYLDAETPDIGEDLYHCGSLLGPFGSNSLTSGIMSQHGRVYDGKIYDQTTATSFPGSSGGIVCLKSDGRYVGMLVMGAGEGFGLIVPVRRMRQWAKEVNVEFALDTTKPVPTDLELRRRPVDDCCPIPDDKANKAYKDRNEIGLKFMVKDERDPLAKANTLKEWFGRAGILWVPSTDK